MYREIFHCEASVLFDLQSLKSVGHEVSNQQPDKTERHILISFAVTTVYCF